jgi:ribose-phosphate pyrophosphokinase
MESERLLLFAGKANRPLAKQIAQQLGLSLGKARVETFKDGETMVKVEENVRGADVFIIQPTCPPVNENLMQLLIMIDALKRSSARRITAVIPYYGYAKQEKKSSGREPITAKLVANLITTAGADRILTVDLHSPAIEGFFDIPVDHLRAGPLLADYMAELKLPNIAVLSPDSGGVHRAYEFWQRIGHARLAFMAKHRPEPEKADALALVGEVADCTVLIIDDMIQSGGTIIDCAKKLKEPEPGHKAVEGDIYVCATHAVFAEGALDNIKQSHITKVIVTDTIPIATESCQDCVTVIPIAPLLAEAIQRIHQDRPLSTLFM